MKRSITMLISGLLLVACAAKAQQGPPPQGQQGPPSPQDRLKHVSEKLSKEMTLTPGQKKKIEDAYRAFFTDMDKLRGKNPAPPPPPPPGKKEDVDKLVKQRDDAIKQVLSTAEFAKYQEVEKTLRPPRPPGRQGPPDDAPPKQ